MTEEAVKIIGCIREVRQRYGINVIAGILAGEERAKLMEYGVMSYKSYGSLKGLQESEIKQIIHQLLVDNLLVTSND